MILADIGNTRAHIYNINRVIHLSHRDAFREYKDRKIYYISVNNKLDNRLKELKNWINISDKIILKGSYNSMGVDRRAICLSYKSGIFISAGSAITVDIMEEGEYMGGFLLLGLTQYIRSYGLISSALKSDLNRDININKLPKNTKDAISYGIIASIKTIIEKHQNGKRVYISGGDGEFLSSFFKNSIFDERLIFKGMKSVIDKDF